MGSNKLQNIIIIFLLCIVIILLGINLIKNNEDEITSAKQIIQPIDPDKDPFIKNQVKNTIVKNAGDIQGCYNEFLQAKPEKVEGQIKMDWQIMQSGQVQRPAVVASEFGSESFFQCLSEKIEKWTFPVPPGSQPKYVAHSFHFKKKDEPTQR